MYPCHSCGDNVLNFKAALRITHLQSVSWNVATPSRAFATPSVVNQSQSPSNIFIIHDASLPLLGFHPEESSDWTIQGSSYV
jgi:hypothetical protein